jgi:hypothetical protein
MTPRTEQDLDLKRMGNGLNKLPDYSEWWFRNDNVSVDALDKEQSDGDRWYEECRARWG